MTIRAEITVLALGFFVSQNLMMPAFAQESPILAQKQKVELQRQQDLAEAPRKAELANALLSKIETNSKRNLDSKYRNYLYSRLVQQSLATLENLVNSGSVIPNAVINNGNSNLVYTPVGPCRLVDTRNAVGSLAVNVQRALKVTGTNFSSQGGNANCPNIPFGAATSVLLNFTAVNPTATGGFLLAKPFNPGGTTFNPATDSSVLNYSSTVSTALANGIAVPICSALSTSGCTSDLVVQSGNAGTDLIADVVGYFQKDITRPDIVATQSFATTTINATCTNYSGGTISFTPPVSGTVKVGADVDIIVQHNTGTAEFVTLYIGTSATDCSTNSNFTVASKLKVPAQFPTTSDYEITVPVNRVFPVTAGTPVTFFLNAVTAGGTASSFYYANLTLQFFPNP
jgi:hypothetical protein